MKDTLKQRKQENRKCIEGLVKELKQLVEKIKISAQRDYDGETDYEIVNNLPECTIKLTEIRSERLDEIMRKAEDPKNTKYSFV